jgi:hypothetical protein
MSADVYGQQRNPNLMRKAHDLFYEDGLTFRQEADLEVEPAYLDTDETTLGGLSFFGRDWIDASFHGDPRPDHREATAAPGELGSPGFYEKTNSEQDHERNRAEN